MVDPVARRPLYLDVAERLRELIYRRELLPGDWIEEPVLCSQLGISRTPLREALKVLQQEGLIELIPRRGCRVQRLEEGDLLALFPVMATLEGLCIQLATEKLQADELERLEVMHDRLEANAAFDDIDGYYEANREFHQAVQELSGNRWLNRITGELRNVLMLARHRQLTVPGRLQESLREHRRIMQALREHDAEAACRAMHAHLCRQEHILRDSPDGGDRRGADAAGRQGNGDNDPGIS